MTAVFSEVPWENNDFGVSLNGRIVEVSLNSPDDLPDSSFSLSDSLPITFTITSTYTYGKEGIITWILTYVNPCKTATLDTIVISDITVSLGVPKQTTFDFVTDSAGGRT